MALQPTSGGISRTGSADAMERATQPKPPSPAPKKNCKCGTRSDGSCKPCASSGGTADSMERKSTPTAPATGVTRATPPTGTADSMDRRTSTAPRRTSSSSTRRSMSADTAEARANQAKYGTPWAPGQYIGGSDRMLDGGGAVVNGRYIPPGINFGSSADMPTVPGMPGSPGSPGSPGGPGRAGGPGQTTAPGQTGSSTAPGSMDQIYGGLLADFDTYRAAEEARINAANELLQAQLSQTDPMAGFKWNTGNVTIPESTLSNYVQAIGGSTGEVDATRALGQSLLNSYLGDVGQYAQGVTSADQTWRSRQQGVATQAHADALRQLALNSMAAKYGIRMGQANQQLDLRNQLLQIALNYGKPQASGGTLNINAPQNPYGSVYVPGVGTVDISQWM